MVASPSLILMVPADGSDVFGHKRTELCREKPEGDISLKSYDEVERHSVPDLIFREG